jgi:hypothetical protein
MKYFYTHPKAAQKSFDSAEHYKISLLSPIVREVSYIASIGGSTIDTLTLNGKTSYAKAYQLTPEPKQPHKHSKSYKKNLQNQGGVSGGRSETSEYPSTA